MSIKQKINQDFGNAAKSYNENANLQKIVLKELYELVKNKFPAKANILDAGSGTGELYNIAGGEFNITQCDIAYGMCKYSDRNNILTVNADIDYLPFPDNYFDGVFSSLVLQWSGDIKHSINELKRVTKIGSPIFISTLGSKTLCELKEAYREINTPSTIIDFHSTEKLADIIGDNAIISSKTITMTYNNVIDLMHNIKNIGARYKNNTGSGLSGRKVIKELSNIYPKNNGSVTASWEVVYIMVSK